MIPSDAETDLGAAFASFGAQAAGASALYGHLAPEIARTGGLALELLAAAQPAQQRPNLLFAAVHDRILAGSGHPLAGYYPSVGGPHEVDGDTAAVFEDFLAVEREPLLVVLRSSATQTNEVGRCGALWPALRQLAAYTASPVTLIDVGTSAGLNLQLDRFAYRHAGTASGDDSSPVTLAPVVSGPWPRLRPPPSIAARIGIDRAPLDPSRGEDARWLRACVWPEQTGRLTRLEAALTVAQAHPAPRIVTGEALTVLPEVIAAVPDGALPCILHSAVLAYLDTDARAAFEATLERIGGHRDVARISFEGVFVPPFAAAADRDRSTHDFQLGLTVWREGTRTDHLLADVSPHGDRIRWIGRRL